MPKTVNLKVQFWRAIINCCKFGESKHLYKINGHLPEIPWVFSDNHKDGLKSFSKQMAKFMKTNFPDVKYVGKIKVSHWNLLLAEKAEYCSTKTLILYTSYIRKLALVLEQYYLYKHPLDWKTGLIAPTSKKTPDGELLRVQQMTRNHYKKIMDNGKEGNAGQVAIELSYRFGLRVEECSDIKKSNIFINEIGAWGFGYIDIYGKGKRYRKVDARTQEDKDFLIRITAGFNNPDDSIVGIKKASINDYLREILKKSGINTQKFYPATGIHSIRKLWAQETYNWLMKEKKSTELQAIRYCNSQLGHSEDRDIALLEIYVKTVAKKRELERELRKNNKSGK